jgi:hypothetical protein
MARVVSAEAEAARVEAHVAEAPVARQPCAHPVLRGRPLALPGSAPRQAASRVAEPISDLVLEHLPAERLADEARPLTAEPLAKAAAAPAKAARLSKDQPPEAVSVAQVALQQWVETPPVTGAPGAASPRVVRLRPRQPAVELHRRLSAA